MENAFALVGDIGGTNARFALVQPGSVRPEQIRVLAGREHDNLDSAVYHYLQDVGVSSVSEACFAFAGPVFGDEVKLTNSHWSFSKSRMAEILGLKTLKIINDFTAMALGIPHVPDDRLIRMGGGAGQPSLPRLIIGPGTGLGVAGLVRARNHWIPITTEGGHVDFAPTTLQEIEILKRLLERFGRVSVERILCGEGLVNLYTCLCEIQGTFPTLDTPRDITEAALDGKDTLAVQTLDQFCEILGRVAGNAVLTLGALGGVYIVGGIVPRFPEFFLRSRFRSAFEDKGRMKPLLEGVPVFIVTEPYPGLLGAAEGLFNPEV